MNDKIIELWEYATDESVPEKEQKDIEQGAIAFMEALGKTDKENKIAATFFYTGAAIALQSAQEEIERLRKENEGLKYCGNCEHSGPYKEDWWPCETCNRSNGMGYKDNWEPKP